MDWSCTRPQRHCMAGAISIQNQVNRGNSNFGMTTNLTLPGCFYFSGALVTHLSQVRQWVARPPTKLTVLPPVQNSTLIFQPKP